MSMIEIPVREIREGDRILSASRRYHGPSFTVTETRATGGGFFRVAGVWGREGQHPATLAGVSGERVYMVERGH